MRLSVGAGYGERTLLYPLDTQAGKRLWCKQPEASYQGVIAEVDGMVKWNVLFLSVGCHTVDFKYVDANIGIGIIF
jgi:hypothetical protein